MMSLQLRPLLQTVSLSDQLGPELIVEVKHEIPPLPLPPHGHDDHHHLHRSSKRKNILQAADTVINVLLRALHNLTTFVMKTTLYSSGEKKKKKETALTFSERLLKDNRPLTPLARPMIGR